MTQRRVLLFLTPKARRKRRRKKGKRVDSYEVEEDEPGDDKHGLVLHRGPHCTAHARPRVVVQVRVEVLKKNWGRGRGGGVESRSRDDR
eukprot:2054305-Rhodomonas_salina.1